MSSVLNPKGTVSWKSPSNIALVKYWGKYDRQLPRNPSISFTLSNAHTITEIDYVYNEARKNEVSIDFTFENKPNQKFGDKIKKYVESIYNELPILGSLDLKIKSQNSFPHSSGIASSASSMSALVLCLLSIDQQINGHKEIDFEKASHLSRLASGSASRSVFQKIAVWGRTDHVAGSSNDFAIPYHIDVDPIFLNFHDDILIASAKEKSVSSTAGHALMNNNPYSAARFQQANDHLGEIIKTLKNGDLGHFGHIVEKEALTLHALMMASDPPYILLEPTTISMIRIIQEFRKSKGVPVFFTLDAGPNIHLLYPHKYASSIIELKDALRDLCVDGRIIEDVVGDGPIKLK